jgi:hypothetical protein
MFLSMILFAAQYLAQCTQTSLEIAKNLVHLKSLCFPSFSLVSSMLQVQIPIRANSLTISFEGFCRSRDLVSV